MELVLIYLWLKLDAFITVLCIGLVFSIVAAATTLIVWEEADEYGRPTEEAIIKAANLKVCRMSWRKRWVVMFMGLLVPYLLIPNSKETATLVLSHYALSLAQSPEGEKVFKLIRATANNILDAELQKLQPKQQGK